MKLICMHEAQGSLKQWLPNGKLLLLSLTKCHGVPCSLASRIAKLQDFFFKTETKTKAKCSRPRLSFLSSRRLETKTQEGHITGFGLINIHI